MNYPLLGLLAAGLTAAGAAADPQGFFPAIPMQSYRNQMQATAQAADPLNSAQPPAGWYAPRMTPIPRPFYGALRTPHPDFQAAMQELGVTSLPAQAPVHAPPHHAAILATAGPYALPQALSLTAASAGKQSPGQMFDRLIKTAEHYDRLLNSGGYREPNTLVTPEKPPLWRLVWYKWLVARQRAIQNMGVFIARVRTVEQQKAALRAVLAGKSKTGEIKPAAFWADLSAASAESSLLWRQALEMAHVGASLLVNYCTECVAGSPLVPQVQQAAHLFWEQAKSVLTSLTPEVFVMMDPSSAFMRQALSVGAIYSAPVKPAESKAPKKAIKKKSEPKEKEKKKKGIWGHTKRLFSKMNPFSWGKKKQKKQESMAEDQA